MAADSTMRRRSRRIRKGSACAMKPCGGIRSLLKSSGSNGNSSYCGIPTQANSSETVDHIVKPGSAESGVKPSSDDSAEEAWIYLRGCRIERSGLRFNSQGDVYVPDSEDEEEALVVSTNGPVGVDLALAVAADGIIWLAAAGLN